MQVPKNITYLLNWGKAHYQFKCLDLYIICLIRSLACMLKSVVIAYLMC